MMEKTTRRLLSQHDIVELYNTKENFSDDVRRYVKNANQGIDDFILLANKLTNSTQKEIFSYVNTKRLLEALLNGNTKGLHSYTKKGDKMIFKGTDEEQDNEFNNRILHIAALLVEYGTKVCIEHYARGKNPTLIEPMIRILKEAAALCYAVAFPFRVTKSQTLIYDVSNKEKPRKKK
jgi:hypothetical protein